MFPTETPDKLSPLCQVQIPKPKNSQAYQNYPSATKFEMADYAVIDNQNIQSFITYWTQCLLHIFHPLKPHKHPVFKSPSYLYIHDTLHSDSLPTSIFFSGAFPLTNSWKKALLEIISLALFPAISSSLAHPLLGFKLSLHLFINSFNKYLWSIYNGCQTLL